MRLWTLHPQHLDRQGLTAVWREALLAQTVLQGKTRGYKNHPQLTRFKGQIDPLQALAYYLHEVWEEATRRGYHFNASKYHLEATPLPIQVTSGQVAFEFNHLQGKLAQRSPADHTRLPALSAIATHPLFQTIPGEVEDWEKIEKQA